MNCWRTLHIVSQNITPSVFQMICKLMYVQEWGWGLEKDHQAINHCKVAYNDKEKVSGTFDWFD